MGIPISRRRGFSAALGAAAGLAIPFFLTQQTVAGHEEFLALVARFSPSSPGRIPGVDILEPCFVFNVSCLSDALRRRGADFISYRWDGIGWMPWMSGSKLTGIFANCC